MKTKKVVEQEKNRNSQKSMKSVVWVSIRFFEKMCFSLEWKSECVMDDVNGDDEGEEDCLRQDWRSETGSLFQKWGDA